MLYQRQFDQIVGQILDLLRRFGDLAVALQEAVAAEGGHIEVEGDQNILLHPQDLFLRVCIVRNENKVFHFRDVDLLIFAGDEQGSDGDELEASAPDLNFLEVAVNDINSQEKGLGHEVEA